MGHSTKLHTTTQTAGDIFLETLRQDISTHLTSILARSNIGPVILWGEWALLYYGVPVAENHMHLLVPDDQLEIAYQTLLAAGYKDSPPILIPQVSSLDPNLHWEELGCPAYRITGSLLQRNRPVTILLQNYSAAASTFDDADPSSFEQVGGIAVPPQLLLGKSFLKALFKLPRSQSRVRSMLKVWCAYVKLNGYTPLGVDAMDGVSGVDDEMALYWKRGY